MTRSLRAFSLLMVVAMMGATGLVVAPPATAATTATATQVDAGDEHACALTGTQIYCWGRNAYGQLGNASTTDSSTPVLASGGQTWASVSAGLEFTCALTSAGAAYCWGRNNAGQLGVGNSTDSSTPVLVNGSHTWTSISTGDLYACGVVVGGDAYCWGANWDGRLGTGNTTSMDSPTIVTGGHVWTTITAGQSHTCALEGSAAYCWGYNNDGALGDGTTTGSASPVAVTGSISFAKVDAGARFTCGISSSASAYCWGRNATGALGDGSYTEWHAPHAVAGGGTYSAIDSGGGTACAVTTAGVPKCWGDNYDGALGDNSGVVDSFIPVTVSGGLAASAVTMAAAGGCVQTTLNLLYCWGYGTHGTLGNGVLANSPVPVGVIGFAVLAANATVSGIVDPSLTFTVAGRATVCNGQSGTGFQTGSSSSSVSLGHLNPTVIGGGAQDLTLATNAANGFVVYLRTSGTTPNVFRTSGGATIADVSGTHSSPSASLSAGTAGFGYTTNDASIAFGSNKWAALTSTDETVMTASAGTATKSICTGFQATVASTTAAGSYSAAIVYTAVPSF